MQTQPIAVVCPRCGGDIMCTVEVRLLTGHRTDMRLVNLAERMAEHYDDAHGIGGVKRTRPDLVGSLLGPIVESVKVTAIGGLRPPWKGNTGTGAPNA